MNLRFNLHISGYDRRSGGVRGLYFLMESIRKMGIQVSINAQTDENCIDIIPDQCGGKCFGAERIVRFFGYYPDEWYGNRRIPRTELAMTIHDGCVSEDVQRLYDGELGKPFRLPLIFDKMFWPEGKTVKDLLYVPKYKRREAKKPYPKNICRIGRDSYGMDELAAKLRTVENLYSVDETATINFEGLLCGCNVWLVRGVSEFEPFKCEWTKELVMNAENGVRAAQDFVNRCLVFFSDSGKWWPNCQVRATE
jgi:hypothetical protein